MEIPADPQHGLTVVLAVLAIGLALHFVKWIVEFFKDTFSKRVEQGDQMAADLIRIEYQLKEISEKLGDVKEMKRDVNRVMIGIRILAGDRWPDVQEAIVKDIFHGQT